MHLSYSPNGSILNGLRTMEMVAAASLVLRWPICGFLQNNCLSLDYRMWPSTWQSILLKLAISYGLVNFKRCGTILQPTALFGVSSSTTALGVSTRICSSSMLKLSHEKCFLAWLSITGGLLRRVPNVPETWQISTSKRTIKFKIKVRLLLWLFEQDAWG